MYYRFAKVKMGQPAQEVEMELDMLLADFYAVTTTSARGSRYDDFFSGSYGMSFLFRIRSCQQLC